MKKCPKCGLEYEDKYKFCPKCRVPLKEMPNKPKCPNCGEFLEESDFCPFCGWEKKEDKCPSCGEVLEMADFCPICGWEKKEESVKKETVSSVGLGDGNAISGGVDASSGSHNTTQVSTNKSVTNTKTSNIANTSTSNSNNTTTNVFNIQGGMSGAIGGFNLGANANLTAELYEVTFTTNTPCKILDRYREIGEILEVDEYGRGHLNISLKKGMHRFEFVSLRDPKIKKEIIQNIKTDEDTIIDIELDGILALPQTEVLSIEESVASEEPHPVSPSQESTAVEEVVSDVKEHCIKLYNEPEHTDRPNEKELNQIDMLIEVINNEFVAAYSKDMVRFWGFEETSSLAQYAVSEYADVICDEAFSDALLESIYLPRNISLISESAFDRCDNLKEIIVPFGSLQDFKGKLPRKLWTLLKEGERPKENEDIEVCFTVDQDWEHYFSYLSKSKGQIFYSSKLKRILGLHRDFCQTEVTIPPCVEIICNSAFNRCDTIEKIYLTPSITNIGNGVFEFCPNLKEIIVPKGAKEYFLNMLDKSISNLLVESESFCPEFTEFVDTMHFEPSENQVGEHIHSKLVADYSADGKQLIAVKEDANWLKEYHVLNGTEVICHEAFKYCAVNTVFLPKSVQKVGKKIFEFCNNLKEICIPKGQSARFMKMLPDYVGLMVEVPVLPQRPNITPVQEEDEQEHFMFDPNFGLLYSTDLSRVTNSEEFNTEYVAILPNTKVICDFAFANISADKIYIPRSIEVIGKDAFSSSKIRTILTHEECLERIRTMVPETIRIVTKEEDLCQIQEDTLPEISTVVDMSEGAMYEYIDGYPEFVSAYSPDLKRFFGLNEHLDVADYRIKEGTEVVCDNAFGDTKIKSVFLPASVVAIGDKAFANCTNLNKIRVKRGTKLRFAEMLPGLEGKIVEVVSLAATKSRMSSDQNEEPIKKESPKPSTPKKTAKVPLPPKVSDTLKSEDINAKVVKYSKNGKIFEGIGGGKYKGNVLQIKDGVTTIQDPYKITSIEYEFDEALEIETVILPLSIKKIEYGAFGLMFNLRKIVIPRGSYATFKRINPEYFHLYDDGVTPRPWCVRPFCDADTVAITGKLKVENIYSPPSDVNPYLIINECKIINKNVGANKNFTTIYLGEGVQEIKNGAFKNCKSLTELYLPKSIKVIETGGFIASKPFDGCTKLRKIYVPKGHKTRIKKLLAPLHLDNLVVEK